MRWSLPYKYLTTKGSRNTDCLLYFLQLGKKFWYSAVLQVAYQWLLRISIRVQSSWYNTTLDPHVSCALFYLYHIPLYYYQLVDPTYNIIHFLELYQNKKTKKKIYFLEIATKLFSIVVLFYFLR